MHHPRKTAPGRAIALLAAVALVCGDSGGGHAADPQPYTVTIKPTGNAALDQAASGSSVLVSLHDTAPVGPFALVTRARTDAGRLDTVLGSFGYYAGKVAITIAGRSLDDPGLVDALDATPAGTNVPVAVTLEPGTQFHLRNVQVTGALPADARGKLDLPSGAPAVASDVLAAHDRLLAYLQGTGHALAKVDAPVATLVPQSNALDVAFRVDAGPRVDLGQISISGLDHVNESFVRRRLLLHSGEQYSPATIQAAREDLASEGVFSSVRINTPDRLAPDGTLPVDVQVAERPRRVVNLSASYSTDLGVAMGASWTHRNLFGNGEELTLHATATELGGSDAKQPGYNVGARYAIPDWLARDQTLTFNVYGIKEYLDAYDITGVLGSAVVSRKLSKEITVSAGLAGEKSSVIQEHVTHDYTLGQLPLTAAFDNTGSLFDPTHGVKATVTVMPTQSFEKPASTFVIMQATASTYFDLAAPGRSVLALRGLVGSVQGASTFEIPPDQRFYGGGTGTVRGYKYQNISPKFPDGNPIGGTSIVAGTVEFRQRFGANYGAVVFVDAGQVASGSTPFAGEARVGVGFGARYYTSIGPIRVDVAFPTQKGPKDQIVQAYIGIGQAF
jgi:translocation and assembly module TamA